MMWLGRGNEWEDATLESKESIEKSDLRVDDTVCFHPGELKRKHGANEFAKLVANGTFEKCEDEAGNEKYRKLTEVVRKSIEHKKMTTKQTRSIDDEDVLKIQDAMEEKCSLAWA